MDKGKKFRPKGNYGQSDATRISSNEAEILTLKRQVAELFKLVQGGTSAKTDIVSLEDLKVTELKALCEEHGVDTTDFGRTKEPYVKALQSKGL